MENSRRLASLMALTLLALTFSACFFQQEKEPVNNQLDKAALRQEKLNNLRNIDQAEKQMEGSNATTETDTNNNDATTADEASNNNNQTTTSSSDLDAGLAEITAMSKALQGLDENVDLESVYGQ